MPSAPSHHAKSATTPNRKWLPYKLLEVLGEGGTGIAFLARERPSAGLTGGQGLVVVEPIKSKHLSDRAKLHKAHNALARECHFLRHLHRPHHHPNIVGFRGWVRSPDGNRCLVLQHCGGGDVHRFMNGGGGLGDERIFREVLKDIATVLDHLRVHKVVHNDVKGENVLIIHDEGSPDMTFLLADFDHATEAMADGTIAMGRGRPGRHLRSH